MFRPNKTRTLNILGNDGQTKEERTTKYANRIHRCHLFASLQGIFIRTILNYFVP